MFTPFIHNGRNICTPCSHNDLAEQVRSLFMNQLDTVNLLINGSVLYGSLWQTDIPRLRAGKVGGQVRGQGSCSLVGGQVRGQGCRDLRLPPTIGYKFGTKVEGAWALTDGSCLYIGRIHIWTRSTARVVSSPGSIPYFVNLFPVGGLFCDKVASIGRW